MLFFYQQKAAHKMRITVGSTDVCSSDLVMYVTRAYSIVSALEPRDGHELWKFDPKVARDTDRQGCCDVANRGVAAWNGKVYVGAYDGRLIALDAKTGKPVWSTDSVIDHTRSYTVTGAPRIIKGRVIQIGRAHV